MDALAIVEREVRDMVRDSGIDPVEDPIEVRRIIDSAMLEYDRRSMVSALPVLGEFPVAAQRIYDAVAGLGELQPLLDDPEIEEIWINGPNEVFCARGGRAELTSVNLSASRIRDLVEKMLKFSGRRLDFLSPFVDASLPDGSRLHVVIPDITRRHWAVNIRKFVSRASSLDDLVRLGALSLEAATFLASAVSSGLNVLVSGATDTQTEPHMFQQARRHANLLIHDLSSVSGACEDQCMNTKRKVRGIRAPSVRAGRSLGVVPHAHLCEGGIVRKTYLGFSLKHAAKRAQRALGRPASIQLGVS